MSFVSGHPRTSSFACSSLVLGALVWGASVVAVPGVAHADPPNSADRSTAAEDLFQRAKGLLTQRNFAAACPMFLESYRLDPAGGTLQNLAVCYEEEGKWASAYARFQELRAMSKGGDHPRPDRVKLADDHIAKLAPRLSRMVVVLPHELVATGVVTLDGVGYLQPSWSAGIVVDPGKHELVVSAPGKRPYRKTLDVSSEAKQEEVRVPSLADEPRAPAQPPPVSPTNGRVTDSPATRGGEEHPYRTTGIIVGGIGLAALVTGGVFGVLTFSKNSAAKDRCSAGTNTSASRDDFDPASGRCYSGSPAWADANAMKDDARTLATVANVLVPVGILGAGIGVYLFLKGGARSDQRVGSTKVQVVPSLGGALVTGSF
ncbi:MAG: hypothetical protein K0S65_6564 [Labilithrix sp.]|nr:hypothetical protein [Labilithrix sp.]